MWSGRQFNAGINNWNSVFDEVTRNVEFAGEPINGLGISENHYTCDNIQGKKANTDMLRLVQDNWVNADDPKVVSQPNGRFNRSRRNPGLRYAFVFHGAAPSSPSVVAPLSMGQFGCCQLCYAERI